jgi:hypothetical protein
VHRVVGRNTRPGSIWAGPFVTVRGNRALG